MDESRWACVRLLAKTRCAALSRRIDSEIRLATVLYQSVRPCQVHSRNAGDGKKPSARAVFLSHLYSIFPRISRPWVGFAHPQGDAQANRCRRHGRIRRKFKSEECDILRASRVCRSEKHCSSQRSTADCDVAQCESQVNDRTVMSCIRPHNCTAASGKNRTSSDGLLASAQPQSYPNWVENCHKGRCARSCLWSQGWVVLPG